MDVIPKHTYLHVNPNALEEVRRDINLHRPGEMKEAVSILQEWIQQQAHFKKKDLPSNYLEQILVASKGSIERAKRAVDSMCTVRTLIPKYFIPNNAEKNWTNVWDKNFIVFLPKMTTENDRIFLVKLVGKYDKAKDLDILYNYIYMLFESIRMYDYCNKIVVIYDLLEMDILDALTNMNLLELKKFYEILLDCVCLRLRRFHLITDSKFIYRFLTFFKPLFKKKLMDRVQVNKSADELFQYYSKDILPKELGGNQKSILDLQDECLKLVSSDEYLKYARSMFEAKVDESLRPQSQFNEMYAGIVGTFRTLNLD